MILSVSTDRVGSVFSLLLCISALCDLFVRLIIFDPCALSLSTSGHSAVCLPVILYASPTAFVQDFSRFIYYKCNTRLLTFLLYSPSSLAV